MTGSISLKKIRQSIHQGKVLGQLRVYIIYIKLYSCWYNVLVKNYVLKFGKKYWQKIVSRSTRLKAIEMHVDLINLYMNIN